MTQFSDPKRDRKIYRLHAQNQWSTDRLARRFGLSLSQVRRLLARFKRQPDQPPDPTPRRIVIRPISLSRVFDA